MLLKKAGFRFGITRRVAGAVRRADGRERRCIMAAELPAGPYSVIYADPPWSYADKSRNRIGAVRHYQTMTTADLCGLPVASIAASDSILFMWATFPNLPAALAVIEAWGFVYKTLGFSWIKTNPVSATYAFGPGHYTRANCEICLIGTRGRPVIASRSVSSVIVSDRRRHSQKPDETRDRIVQLCGDVPRVELFARQATPGWDVWGNEV